MKKSECKFSELIPFFLEENLSQEEKEKFSEHLKNCPSCQNDIKKYEKIEELFSQIEDFEAPADLKNNVLSKIKIQQNKQFSTQPSKLINLFSYKSALRFAQIAAVFILFVVALHLYTTVNIFHKSVEETDWQKQIEKKKNERAIILKKNEMQKRKDIPESDSQLSESSSELEVSVEESLPAKDSFPADKIKIANQVQGTAEEITYTTTEKADQEIKKKEKDETVKTEAKEAAPETTQEKMPPESLMQPQLAASAITKDETETSLQEETASISSSPAETSMSAPPAMANSIKSSAKSYAPPIPASKSVIQMQRETEELFISDKAERKASSYLSSKSKIISVRATKNELMDLIKNKPEILMKVNEQGEKHILITFFARTDLLKFIDDLINKEWIDKKEKAFDEDETGESQMHQGTRMFQVLFQCK